MKTKTRKTSPLFEPETPEATPIDTPEANGNKPDSRLHLRLNEDGSINVAEMRDKTRERFRKAISMTPGLLSETSDSPKPYLFPPQVIHAMYGAIGTVEAMIATNMGKVPQDIAKKVFTYSEQELNLLTPPTERVLAKYASDWLIRYQDEIALATLLTSITVNKVNAAMMLGRVARPITVQAVSQEESAKDPEKEGDEGKVQPN